MTNLQLESEDNREREHHSPGIDSTPFLSEGAPSAGTRSINRLPPCKSENTAKTCCWMNVISGV